MLKFATGSLYSTECKSSGGHWQSAGAWWQKDAPLAAPDHKCHDKSQFWSSLNAWSTTCLLSSDSKMTLNSICCTSSPERKSLSTTLEPTSRLYLPQTRSCLTFSIVKVNVVFSSCFKALHSCTTNSPVGLLVIYISIPLQLVAPKIETSSQ